jgi:hypothetical protein
LLVKVSTKASGEQMTNGQTFFGHIIEMYFHLPLNDMDGKTLDAALHKNKLIKANLNMYVKGSNSPGIMRYSFKHRTTLMVVLLQELLSIATSLSLPMMLSQSSFRARAGGKRFHQLRCVKATGRRGYARH